MFPDVLRDHRKAHFIPARERGVLHKAELVQQGGQEVPLDEPGENPLPTARTESFGYGLLALAGTRSDHGTLLGSDVRKGSSC